MVKYFNFQRVALITIFSALIGVVISLSFQDKPLLTLVMFTFIAFWVGVAWAANLISHEKQEELSHPLSLIDEDGKLHSLMKIGSYYKVLACLSSHCEAGEHLYVLRATSGGEDGKIFLAWAEEHLNLPTNFQVVKKTEERGARMRTTTFVFE